MRASFSPPPPGNPDVQPRDEGEYACQLNNLETPMELVHTLSVLSKSNRVDNVKRNKDFT